MTTIDLPSGVFFFFFRVLFLKGMLMELFEELSSSAKVGCQEGTFPTEEVSRPVISAQTT